MEFGLKVDEIYGNYFFSKFYELNGGGDYRKKEHWKPFFDNIAKNIVEKFNPKTVLDAGCAMGYLVEALRSRGVEAYGFDVSDYAISNADEKIKPYCFVHSITDDLPGSLPQKFDLIVTIEVLEHLFPEDGSKAIKNLCKYSDTIIFTSTPNDIEDMTHLNVQQSEYWCKEFAKNMFFKDHVQPVNFICDWAMLFRKKENFPNVIFDYEMYDRIEKIKCEKLKLQISDQENEINKLNEDLTNYSTLKTEYNLLKDDYKEIENQLNELKIELKGFKNKYDEISNASWWKVTKPCRVICSAAKKFILKNRFASLFYKGIKSLTDSGVSETLEKIKNVQKVKKKDIVPSKEELERQREVKFDNQIKFSVIVPLYNTPKKFLNEMIKSVINQTYSDWELCLSDGSDFSFSYVEDACKKFAKKDSRIKYKRLEENLRISGNTNASLSMATGDYIALFDHDDVLNPSALYENAKVINEQKADFIYSDEAIFQKNIYNVIGRHYKPNFSMDNLRANNYVCHFTVFDKSLLDKVGNFRDEFNGSQDHDMVLRLTEKAEKIVHIPKILYFWRCHKNSVASGTQAKSYAIEAGINAVKSHLKRCKMQGEVESSKVCPTIYRIKYEIKGEPLVSILIPNKDHISDLNRCIKSILEKSTYKNFEIIIIENNSKDKETFDYYDNLKSKNKIKIVNFSGEFNYSNINNFGVDFTKGKHIILLNNDTEVIADDWIQEMLMFSQREDVGAVGAKLYYPDDTIQHAGIVLGLGSDEIAGHVYLNEHKSNAGYIGNLHYAQELSAVTGACMMIPKHVFEKVGGLDPLFAVAFNDIDLCMRIRKSGYKIIWTPYAELYHYESKSRGYEDTSEKQKRFQKEVNLFKERWGSELKKGDPFYNPNLLQ